MARRQFLSLVAGVPLVAAFAGATRAWGSDDPTKASFPFLHGHALMKPGHNVQIFLRGEAVGLMRRSDAEAVVPVAWPPLINTLRELAEARMPIYACGACSRARNVTEADLAHLTPFQLSE